MKEPKKKSTEEVLKEKLFEMTELWEVAKERLQESEARFQSEVKIKAKYQRERDTAIEKNRELESRISVLQNLIDCIEQRQKDQLIEIVRWHINPETAKKDN